jgi:CoA-transferase family III
VHRLADADRDDELLVAARSGLMGLTGQHDGPPLEPPAGLVKGLDRLASDITKWSSVVGRRVLVDWAELVMIRADLFGLHRGGRVSANGSCRLLRAKDGWLAVNLPRVEDLASVAALVERDEETSPWEALELACGHRCVSDLVDRGHMLGLPVAELGSPPMAQVPCTTTPLCASVESMSIADLNIVDLSSMWAGPLAAHMIALCGGKVVKVESTKRPDGARNTPPFYRSLHADHQKVVTLDFRSSEGRSRLNELVTEADVVIESSRPRALEQLGSSYDQIEQKSGKIWLSITGYGRDSPQRDWVAFGDDAAVAGGLVSWEDDDLPVFCGDALADPVAGMTAAIAALKAIASGGGLLLDVSMRACGAALVDPSSTAKSLRAERYGSEWCVTVGADRVSVREPVAPQDL